MEASQRLAPSRRMREGKGSKDPSLRKTLISRWSSREGLNKFNCAKYRMDVLESDGANMSALIKRGSRMAVSTSH